jgi:hypothetical protein
MLNKREVEVIELICHLTLTREGGEKQQQQQREGEEMGKL